MGTKIVELWVEIHHADSEQTPEEHLDAALVDLQAYAELNDGKVVVVRTNAFTAPEPEPSGVEAPETSPIPDDGSTGGDA